MYLLSHRHEAFDMFKRFIIKVETQLQQRVKILRVDQGRKYLSDVFKEFNEGKGI